MASYVLPQVRIFQELIANVDADARKAVAFLCGGHATLYRYAQSDEKVKILLGGYDEVGENVGGEWKTCYSWPNKPAGSIIDQTYTKLFIDKALLRYFADIGHTLTKTASNEVRHPTKSFADHGTSYLKSADFLDRGVKVGDPVYVKATVSATDYELFTYVQGFRGEAVAAVIGTAAANSANQGTAGATATKTADSDNSGVVLLGSVNGAAYSGYAEGDVEETYTVEVIQGSTGGDPSTALLRITSASGRDDVAEQVPGALGYYSIPIGTRGLNGVFAAGSGSDYTLGDKWTVFVREAWTATVPTAAGSYTGDQDRTYLVEVTTGGLTDATDIDNPYITVTTVDGSDFSGPTLVPTGAATAVPIGRFGVTMSFSTAKLRQGDRFQVTTTAATTGAYKTLILAHNLADEITEDDDSVDLEITLYIKKDIQVGEKHVANLGDYNWSQSNTEFCASAGIQAYDETWTDDGDPQPLPVVSNALATSYNQMYVEYRSWNSTLLGVLNTIYDIADLDTAVSGSLTPDNPLKFALSKALTNNNGQPVRYTAVADPAVSADWVDVLDLIEDRPDVYGLVPLTQDEAILDLFQAHCQSQSNEEHKRYRVLWACLPEVLTKSLVTASLSSDEEVVLATTQDDGDTSGTQYTKFRITSSNADLVELGVRAGDIARFKYQADAWGDVTYSEYEIDSVLSEDTFLAVSGTEAAENVPIKIEIWRNLAKTEQAEENGRNAGNYADRRVRAVWPPEIGEAGETFSGIHLCAALAALAGGVSQNQGLTHVEVKGFDDLSKTLKFNRSQLDTMAVNGVWIVTQDRESGEVFNRHALTTADYESINEREESITRNWDLICFRFDDQFSPYIGKCNAVQGMIDIIAAEFEAAKESMRTPISPSLGPILVDAEITELRISPVFKDRILLSATLTLPYALNNIDFHTFV